MTPPLSRLLWVNVFVSHLTLNILHCVMFVECFPSISRPQCACWCCCLLPGVQWAAAHYLCHMLTIQKTRKEWSAIVYQLTAHVVLHHAFARLRTEMQHVTGVKQTHSNHWTSILRKSTVIDNVNDIKIVLEVCNLFHYAFIVFAS